MEKKVKGLAKIIEEVAGTCIAKSDEIAHPMNLSTKYPKDCLMELLKVSDTKFKRKKKIFCHTQ